MHYPPIEWILLAVLITLSASGLLFVTKPIHAALSFLVTLLLLAIAYLLLGAEFLALIQILIYAGAILIIFLFVVVLFQSSKDNPRKSSRSELTLFLSGGFFTVILATYALLLIGEPINSSGFSLTIYSTHELGKELYTTFFFPFEAMIPLFLTALVGITYFGRTS